MQCLFFVIDNFFVLAGLARIFDWPPTFLMRSTQSSQLVSISRLQVARKKEGIFADFFKILILEPHISEQVEILAQPSGEFSQHFGFRGDL